MGQGFIHVVSRMGQRATIIPTMVHHGLWSEHP